MISAMSSSSSSEKPDLQAALESLPHGASFRFVDELISLNPGVEGEGIYEIRGDEAFLEGHFPENPLMPGVILIEALTQLGGIVAQTDPEHEPLANLRLTAVRNAKILGSARPRTTIRIEAKVKGRLGGLIQVEGQVTKSGVPLLTAAVVLSGEA